MAKVRTSRIRRKTKFPGSEFGVKRKMLRIALCEFLQGRTRPGRKGEQVQGPLNRRRWRGGDGRFSDDHMGIRAAQAKRTDSSNSRLSLSRSPGPWRGWNHH